MMNFENCEIGNIVIHDIGNKYEEGDITVSPNLILLPDEHGSSQSAENLFS